MDLQLIKTKDIKELKQQLEEFKKDHLEILDKWLNTDEASAFLKVGKKTLQRYRDAGKLAYSKDGKSIWYKKSDLIKFLNRNYFSIDNIENK